MVPGNDFACCNSRELSFERMCMCVSVMLCFHYFYELSAG